jgi:hypothetical protein
LIEESLERAKHINDGQNPINPKDLTKSPEIITIGGIKI